MLLPGGMEVVIRVEAAKNFGIPTAGDKIPDEQSELDISNPLAAKPRFPPGRGTTHETGRLPWYGCEKYPPAPAVDKTLNAWTLVKQRNLSFPTLPVRLNGGTWSHL